MQNALNRIVSLQVADAMSKNVVWVTARQRMADVATILLKHEISLAPVVDESGYCVGIISATDFLRRDGATKLEETASHHAKPAWQAEDLVGTFMTNAVQSIDSHATLLQAAKVMCSQHVHRLPVVDDKGHVVGVISTMDIVAALTNAMAETELIRL